jgi:hypothetical protein
MITSLEEGKSELFIVVLVTCDESTELNGNWLLGTSDEEAQPEITVKVVTNMP